MQAYSTRPLPAVRRCYPRGGTLSGGQQQMLAIADRSYVVVAGEVVLSGTGGALLADEQIKAAFLGF